MAYIPLLLNLTNPNSNITWFSSNETVGSFTFNDKIKIVGGKELDSVSAYTGNCMGTIIIDANCYDYNYLHLLYLRTRLISNHKTKLFWKLGKADEKEILYWNSNDTIKHNKELSNDVYAAGSYGYPLFLN